MATEPKRRGPGRPRIFGPEGPEAVNVRIEEGAWRLYLRLPPKRSQRVREAVLAAIQAMAQEEGLTP